MTKKIVAIDINLNRVESRGTAYYRIHPELRNFIEICRKKYDVVGFEYDNSLNFGIILGKKKPKTNGTDK